VRARELCNLPRPKTGIKTGGGDPEKIILPVEFMAADYNFLLRSQPRPLFNQGIFKYL
jgi:hypothetical protein